MDADGSSLDDASHSALKPDAFDADLFIDMPALGASYVGTMPGGGSSILERNLDAIRASCARTAQLIEQAAPRTDITFIETDDVCPDSGEPVLSATIGTGDETRALSSKRRPLAEAQKLADGFDIKENGAAAVLGFGLGHHAKAIARVVQKMGVVLCFEPDVALLRAVFERIDHSQWMAETNFAIFTDPADPGLISARLKGFEPTVSLGTRIIHHTPSRPRLGKTAAEFSDNLMRVLRAIRTNLVTTLLQVEVTQRNLLQNLDHYTNAPGITDLKDCCKDKPAIVVSAGPSLARNIHLLKQPGLRDRFVIVAAQTVLRQLLAEGIKPHFVTALDYHEISKRFYEGLSEQDVQGVTLIAEAKANPAILDAFPGQIRVPDDKYLTAVLGEDLFTARGQLTPGATVAHLACYVARHMGCDPVILVGQDLGFTDGQYYGAGAAIHRVWSGELNAFNSLEMMEWQRIVRGRATLHKVTDTLGRPVYSDEQMLTYLTQFERDFLADADRGLTVIDATEGGVAKQHTRTMPLADAIKKHTPAEPISIPTAASTTDPARTKAVHARVRTIRRDVARVASLARETHALLGRMLDHLDETPVLNDLIRRVERLTQRVMKLEPAYALVQQLNQTGALNRLRADRAISLSDEVSPKARQKLQIERDRINVQWLADAADQLARLFDEANASLCGSPKVTRAPVSQNIGRERPTDRSAHKARVVHAVIPVDLAFTGLGVRRNLARATLDQRNILSQTLARLDACQTITHVALLTDQPSELAAIIGRTPENLTIEYVTIAPGAIEQRAMAVRGSRQWAADCWRGGLGSLTCYDEVFDPALVHAAMDQLDIDAALLLGPDWAMIDPVLTDEIVRRHLERPDSHKIVFAHVPPGLAPCLVDRTLVAEMANESDDAGVFATFGALVGYVPVRPQHDPIVKPLCVRPDAAIRDLGVRCIVDQPRAEQLLVYTSGQAAPADAQPLDALASAPVQTQDWPAQLTLELTTRRLTHGLRAQWLTRAMHAATDAHAQSERLAGGNKGPGWHAHALRAGMVSPPNTPSTHDPKTHPRQARGCTTQDVTTQDAQIPEPNTNTDIDADLDWILGSIEAWCRARPDAALTLAGRGDPLLHPHWQQIIEAARSNGAAVHLRTDLDCDADVLDQLLASGVNVISIDLLADTAQTYETITGTDHFEQVRTNIETLLDRRPTVRGLPLQWILPRLTRCDATYEEVEPFFDHWIMHAGCAVIDPLPIAMPGERIAPLPMPPETFARRFASELCLRVDGGATLGLDTASPTICNVRTTGLQAAWQSVLAARNAADSTAHP